MHMRRALLLTMALVTIAGTLINFRADAKDREGRGDDGRNVPGGRASGGKQEKNSSPSMSRTATPSKPAIQTVRPQTNQSHSHVEQARPQVQQTHSQAQQTHSQMQQVHPQMHQEHRQVQQTHSQVQQPRLHLEQQHPQIQRVRPQVQQMQPPMHQDHPARQQEHSRVQQARSQIQQVHPQSLQVQPQVPQERSQIQTRPQTSQAVNRQKLRSQIDQYASKPAPRTDEQSFVQRKQTFQGQRQEQIVNNKQQAQNVSQHLQHSRSGYNKWFDPSFFKHHNLHVKYEHYHANWWHGARWASVVRWGNWGWSTPYYYDYGDYLIPLEGSTYNQDYNDYYAPLPEVTEPAGGVAADYGEWLPLGVFAIGNSPNEAAVSNRIIQLALNRNGEISGIFYNTTTNMTFELIGTVVPETQRAYWSLTDTPDSPILSTGIYNLAEEELTPVQVYFPDGTGQIWILVRLHNEGL